MPQRHYEPVAERSSATVMKQRFAHPENGKSLSPYLGEAILDHLERWTGITETPHRAFALALRFGIGPTGVGCRRVPAGRDRLPYRDVASNCRSEIA